MKVLLIGGNGLLGPVLTEYLASQGIEVEVASRSNSKISVDLLSKDSIKKCLNFYRPEIVINLVALTNVDQCEENPALAFQMNSLTAKNLGDSITEERLIHVSTDQVYCGKDLNSENDIIPINYYAFSKILGETFLPDSSVILRTNFFGKSKNERKSFTDWIFEKLSISDPVQLVDDVYFSPLSMHELSKQIHQVIKNYTPGVYNLGSNQGMSKFEFGLKFSQLLGFDSRLIEKTSIRSLSLKAQRPLNMRMSCVHYESTFKSKLPILTELIREESLNYQR